MRTTLRLLILLAACGSPPGRPDAAIDPDTPPIDASPDAPACVPACAPGFACDDTQTCVEACTVDGVDLIYVVSDDDDLYRFDPRDLPLQTSFTLIGRLACPATIPTLFDPPIPVRPFSMAIDRNGVAWVEYNSGEVFNVSLTDASCTPTAYVPQAADMKLFGMGYTTDFAGANSEKLFLSGGSNNAESGGRLAYVDTGDEQYTPTIVGDLEDVGGVAAELSGTSEGKLYGFFPRSKEPGFVQEIDKTTGAIYGTRYAVGQNPLAGIQGWAFAFWGGSFYVFITINNNSTVRSINRITGTYAIPIPSLPFTIVGAGVSTCAPIL